MLVIHLKNWMSVCESICQVILGLLQKQKIGKLFILKNLQTKVLPTKGNLRSNLGKVLLRL